MRTLLELQDERGHLIKSSRDIVEKAKKDDERALTEVEKTELAGLHKEIARVDAEITDRTIFDRYDQATAQQMATLESTPRRTIAPDPSNTGEAPRPAVPNVSTRVGKLEAFKGPNAQRDAYRSGQFILAAIFKSDRAARWLRDDGMDLRAMSINTNTAGGFIVPEEMSAAIIDLREQYGVFRRECDVIPMSRDIMTIPRSSGSGTAAFTAENAAITESEPTFNQVTLTAHKLGRIARISTELSDDAIINMSDWLAKHYAHSFALKEDETGFTGDGSASFAGIEGVNTKILLAAHAGSRFIASVALFSTLTTADLTSLMGTLPEYAHPNAKWYCSQLASDTVFGRLAAVAGGNTIQTLAGRFEKSFLGYPIVISQVMPKVTTSLADVVMLLFGDLSAAATLGDRREITVAQSMDRYFELDQIAIKATERIDINAHDLGTASEAGPIVALIGV